MFLNAIETSQVLCKTKQNKKMPPLILHVIKVSLEDNILRNVRITTKKFLKPEKLLPAEQGSSGHIHD